MSSPSEFQRDVISALARLETQMKTTQDAIERHDGKLEELSKFQHRLGGVLSAVSIFASALVSFGVAFVKDRFSKQG